MKIKAIYLLLTTVLFSLSCESQKGLEEHPNVIVILSDDQGWGDFSFTGNANIQTPNIDQIAREGVSFENFYVQAVCSPTRAEFLTARYSYRGGIRSTSEGGERLDADETTIADVFKAAGYQTAAYGKWHNGMQHPYHPNARGFDDFYGFCSGHWGNYFSPMLEHNGEIVKGKGFIIDDLTDKGIEFIEENKDQPFFLYLPYNTPHSPMQVPDKWWNKVKDREISMISGHPSEDNQYTKAAIALCENIDWNVGRITKKLEELGIEENTIVVYFNDNGPNSFRWNGGMRGKKGFVDEGGVRSVLFLKWKSKIKSQIIHQLSGAIDLLPTLAELCNIDYETNKPLDGQSLDPLLSNELSDWEDRTMVNYWQGKVSLRDQQFRLDNKDRLYDILRDRGQQTDVKDQFPEEYEAFMNHKNLIQEEIESELGGEDTRPFSIGFEGAKFTHIPARDGVGHGNIVRSNRWPNCSYFTNWISVKDSITWNVEVAQAGQYQVELYYTCEAGDEGSSIELNVGENSLQSVISEPFESEWEYPEKDRYSRQESYTKAFKLMKMGIITLEKGKKLMTLKAVQKPGDKVIDFRMLMFKKT
ncbi:MAG: sulfatase-like hydrolase/transferase [Bacteroidota bacterium]